MHTPVRKFQWLVVAPLVVGHEDADEMMRELVVGQEDAAQVDAQAQAAKMQMR